MALNAFQDAAGDVLPFLEQLLESMLATDGPERSMAHFKHRIVDDTRLSPNLVGTYLGIDNPIVDRRIDTHRDIILGDDCLLLGVEDAGSQIHADHFLGDRVDIVQACVEDADEFAELLEQACLGCVDELGRGVHTAAYAGTV